MMYDSRAILLPIHPQYCNLIISGEKTIEVRKSVPKLQPPFKCYIYMTTVKERCRFWEYMTAYTNSSGEILDGSQRVIGEFICDEVKRYRYIKQYILGAPKDFYVGEWYEDLPKMCLSEKELYDYGNSKDLFGWHITSLKIYDKPKELGEFKTPPCGKPESACDNCKHKVNVGSYYEPEYDCPLENGRKLTRPPQSWCYINKLIDKR